MKQYFHHVFSKGVNVIFRDEADYIFFTNRLAVARFQTNVDIVAYTIMSTHFHLILNCTDTSTVDNFTEIIKKAYKIYFVKKYSAVIPSEFFTIDRTDIRDFNTLKQKTIYVLRNATHHCADEVPFHYLYSSCKDIFARELISWNIFNCYRLTPLKDLSIRKKRECFGHNDLPDDILIDSRGCIAPKSFVNLSLARQLWENKVKAFLYDMNKSILGSDHEVIKDDAMTLRCMNLSDTQVCKIIDNYSQELGVKSFYHLQQNDISLLQQTLKQRNIPLGQIEKCLWLND